MQKPSDLWRSLDRSLQLTCYVTGIFIAVILVVVLIRHQVGATENLFSIGDIIIAIIPIFIWLILTERVQLKSLTLGGGGLTIATAFEQAHSEAAIKDVSDWEAAEAEPAEWRVVDAADKGNLGRLRELAERRVEALRFRMGTSQRPNHYDAEIIRRFLSVLGADKKFKYIIVEYGNHKLFAVADAPRIIATTGFDMHGAFDLDVFARAVNRGNAATLRKMSPLMLAEDVAINLGATRGEALHKMDAIDAEWLPVVRPERCFAGVVTRSRLVSAMLLQVSEAVRSSGSKQ